MVISLKFISRCLASVHRASGEAVFVLSDSKQKGWEKIGNMRLESHSQVLEETRRI